MRVEELKASGDDNAECEEVWRAVEAILILRNRKNQKIIRIGMDMLRRNGRVTKKEKRGTYRHFEKSSWVRHAHIQKKNH
jgi:hypothetical protein